jgi:hypothetical protein
VLARTLHFGQPHLLNNGQREESEDSWNGEAKTSDGWGYAWKRAYHLNKVVYTTGAIFRGGWFGGDLKVQMRRNHQWMDVPTCPISPRYPFDSTAGPHKILPSPSTIPGVMVCAVIGTPGGGCRLYLHR